MNNLNIATDLQSLVHQYTSEDSMIEEFSKDPKNLIQLFEYASNKENHWHVTNTASFDKIFKRIETLDSEGKFDEEQVQKIISINETIYPSITDSTLRIESNNFFSNHLNDDNVYDRLKYAINIKADDYIRKCLDHIENKTGSTFTVTDSLLTINVNSPKISLDELSKQVSKLVNTFNNQFAITLKPKDSDDLTTLENFIKAHGKFITSLDLKDLENSIDDNFACMAIKFCPNLTFLSINSSIINGNGLNELSSLLNLKTLNFSGCSSLTALSALPEALRVINFFGCSALTSLSSLPEALSSLGFSNCRNLTALPHLPKTLSTLNLFGCTSLRALPVLPKALSTLNLSGNRNLTALPSLPEALYTLDLCGCSKLTVLPALPETLKDLNLFGCKSLTVLPTFPETLSKLILSQCDGLTEDVRFSVLAKIFDRNFDQGLTFSNIFEIKDTDKLFKLIAEQLIGRIESEDYKPVFLEALEKKLSDQTTLPSTQNLLAQFIFENQESLRLHDDHQLIQEAVMVIAAFSIEGENNPFNVIKKLNELSNIPSEFSPQAMTVEGSQIAINMDRLAKLSNAAIIKREALPKNVTRDVFEKLTNDLKIKCENNEEATKALENLGTTWATISTPIFEDPTQFLAGLLDLSGENVSDSEAKWKAVLAWVLDKESVPKGKDNFFTEQEETLIKVMMGVQACKGGKDMGIAITYEWLEPKYQYKLTLTKPATTILEEQKLIERNEAITFLNENLVKNQILNITLDIVKDFGTKNLKVVYPLVYGEEFWDEDEDYNYILNDKGAVEILAALNETKENENLPVKQFIGTAIRKLIVRQFTGTNALMKTIMDMNLNKLEQEELLSGKFDVVDDDMLKNLKEQETEEIIQGAHYAIYLGNLIGHLVGASSNVTFDRYTGVLKAPLLDKKRDDVLRAFFEFVTPKRFVDEIVKVVNVNPVQNKDLLRPYLSDDVYSADGLLSRKGALSLLEQLGYLEKR